MAGNLAFTGQGSGTQPGVISPMAASMFSSAVAPRAGVISPSVSNQTTTPAAIVPSASQPNPLATSYTPVGANNISTNPTTQQGLINTNKATTPVKSMTTGADGSQTVTYHAPTTPDATQGGLLSLATPTTDPTKAQTPTTSATQTSSPSGAPTSYPGIVGGLVDASNKNATIGQNAADIAAKFGQQYSDVGTQAAKAQAGYLTTGTTPVAEGNAAVVANTAANQQKAIAEGESAALQGTAQQLTGQSQQQSGLNQAGNLAAPVNVTPGNALVNPQTGTEQYSGLGGLTGLGIAQQNIAQGKAYQQQAADLSTTLGQIDQLTPTLTNFLNTSGLNQQGTPFYNQSIKSYIGSVKDPSAVASLNTMLADLKTYTAQVLGASGLNPTEVSSTVNSFDPSNLNAEQMTAFVSNLRNLGQIRLKPLQDSAAASYSSGTTPYVGDSANPSVNSASAEQNNSTATSVVGNSDLGQGLAGLGINALGGLEGVMSTIAGTAAKILGA